MQNENYSLLLVNYNVLPARKCLPLLWKSCGGRAGLQGGRWGSVRVHAHECLGVQGLPCPVSPILQTVPKGKGFWAISTEPYMPSCSNCLRSRAVQERGRDLNTGLLHHCTVESLGGSCHCRSASPLQSSRHQQRTQLFPSQQPPHSQPQVVPWPVSTGYVILSKMYGRRSHTIGNHPTGKHICYSFWKIPHSGKLFIA